MARGKMLDDNAIRGDAGIALVHRRVSQMKHVWHDRALDAGIDGTIELRDPATREMSNQLLLVQSKASDRPFPGETEEKFHYICDERDIDYWMKASDPVLLICSHPDTGQAWWAHVQDAFSDPARRAARRIDFDKATQAFSGDITSRLFAVTDPHGRAHTTVADYRSETLVSNLLPVDFPASVFIAQTDARKLVEVYAAQRKTDYPIRSDFVLSHGRIYSWGPMYGTGLVKVSLTAGHETPVGELIGGNADERRLFVRLLNAALQHDLRDDCRWNNNRRFLYFKPTPDLSERKVQSASGRNRIVFKGYYQRKDDPAKAQFYRHAAIRAQFTDLDGDWFCAVTPDYFFTSDGYNDSPFADEYLAKMKRMEKNPAVLGETQLWFGVLGGEKQPSLLEPETSDRILDFGPPVAFTVDRGLDDKEWAAPAEADDTYHPGQMALTFEDFE